MKVHPEGGKVSNPSDSTEVTPSEDVDESATESPEQMLVLVLEAIVFAGVVLIVTATETLELSQEFKVWET